MKIKPISSLLFACSFQVAFSQIVINEIDADTPGTDTAEFVELYDGGAGNTSLDGHVLVLFNGSNDLSYAAYDLSGQTTDGNGFFVIGNVTGAALPLSSIQNGADAVALYTDVVATFPNGTPPTATNLVDAIVYDTNDDDDAGLLGVFGGDQINEGENGDKDNHSIQRNPDGASAFIVSLSTPGVTNDQDPILDLVAVDPTSGAVVESDGPFALLLEVLTPNLVSGDLAVSISIDDGTELAGPTMVTVLDGQDAAAFSLDAVDDTLVDGTQFVEVTVSAAGYQDATLTVAVADDDLLLPEVVINEMQVKASGDDPQFVELYNNDSIAIDISGWSVKAFEADNTDANFGGEVGSVTIPASTSLASNEFYLIGSAIFESLYGVVPDLAAEPGFGIGDLTMILFDGSGNAVYSVLNAGSGASNEANNAGVTILPDISVSDGNFSPAGFFLDIDGGSTGSTLSFTSGPSPLATPGGSNEDFIARLTVEVSPSLIDEAAGTGAATVTITRLNDFAGAATVNLSSSDTSEAVLQSTSVSFGPGDEVLTVDVDAVDDSIVDGVQTVTISASATGYVAGSGELSVTDDDGVIANLVINEMIIDSAGADTEFLEIYNAGTTDVDLAGYSIEKWESDAGQSGVDGGGPILIPVGSPVILPAGGFFLMANSTFQAAYPTVTVDFVIPVNSFENSSATIVLRDVSLNVLHTVFASDGGAGDAANIDGTLVTPDVVTNDQAFALSPDGGTAVFDTDNAVPSSDATPGASNGSLVSNYTVAISNCSASPGQFVINFTAAGSSDVYVSTDLTNWGLATNGGGVASGIFTDTAAPTGKAFYLIQEAGTAAP